MARILLFLAVVFAVWFFVRAAGGRRHRRDAPPEPPPRPVTNAVEPIAQCAWCGVHIPTGAAVSLPDGRIYCGPPHRDRALAAAAPADRA